MAGDLPTPYDPRFVETATIMVVDDDALITKSLRHFFRMELSRDEVKTFNRPRDAVAFAESNNVDLVISDFIMPEMDGLTLLAEIKRLHPEATRILLTGYADKANAIRAINEVGVFQFVEKPWDAVRLAATVRAGLEQMALRRTLRELIERLDVEQSTRERLAHALIRVVA